MDEHTQMLKDAGLRLRLQRMIHKTHALALLPAVDQLKDGVKELEKELVEMLGEV